MNKFTYAAISLIGAVPGGFFSYKMVAAMLDHFKDMNGLLRIISCLSLAVGALMAVMPIGIVIFTSKPKSEEEEQAEAKSAEVETAEESDDIESSEIDDELGSLEDPDAEPVAAAESEESVVIDTEGMFDEDIYEADEELEEEAPAKKKKKKKK